MKGWWPHSDGHGLSPNCVIHVGLGLSAVGGIADMSSLGKIAMGQQETLAQDGHVLGHRLDNLDESTPYRWQVGSSSEDDSDWAKPRQFINGQRYHSGSRCGLLDAVS